MDEIFLAHIERNSYVNGPGVRTVCFFQGCNRFCKGCHNTHISNKNSGQRYTVEQVANFIFKTNNPFKKVTISGGEPLNQKKGLIQLVDLLFENNYEIALYTSYEFEEVPEVIRSKIKYLKTGRYLQDKSIENHFYGSENQKLLVLENGIKVGEYNE